MAEKKKAKFLSYKGKPLVRCGNTIYYGYANEPYVILIQIKSSKKVKELDVADKVTVQLVKTDPTLRPKDSMVKALASRSRKAPICSLSTVRTFAPICSPRSSPSASPP